MSRRTRQADAGFTMIELLLALVLSALLTAALSTLIGQAARDRQAMASQTRRPQWIDEALDLIEHDLAQARLWAGTDDRVVLIAMDRGGLPARIEYHWRDTGTGGVLLREAHPLIQGHAEGAGPEILASRLEGVGIGPYRLGLMMAPTPTSPPGNAGTPGTPPPAGTAQNDSRASIVIGGQSVPLRALPDQAEAVLVLPRSGEAPQRYTRGVVLR